MNSTQTRIFIRVLFGGAAAALGAALIFAPVTVHGIAVITGSGLISVGIVSFLRPGSALGASGVAPRTPSLTRMVGGALILIGALMALWPDAGAPWLAFLVGAGLVIHGALALSAAIVGRDLRHADARWAAAIMGAATIVLGIVAFSWPVLTLAIFRLGLALWLIAIGLHAIWEAVLQLRSIRTNGAIAGASLVHVDSRPRAGAPPSRLRRWTRTLGAVASLAAAALLAWGSGTVLGGSPMPQPGAFYEAPANVPDEPGRLLRSEPLDTGVPAGARAWKILYTSTHPDGSPAISSGTVLAPAEPSERPLPLLSIAHGTTGVVPQCAPSMSAAPFSDGAGTALAEMVTQHGWLAVTSDYVGLGTGGVHPYLVGDAEARNVLDASRAVQQLDAVTTTTETVVWGHSQGGQGALWTGQIAEDYAPELTVRGVAAFAPAADLFGLAEVDKNDAAGKTVSAYIATTWARLYPDLDLKSQLTPGAPGAVEHIRSLCCNGNDVLAAILRGSQIPNQIFPDRLLNGEFGDRLKAQTPVGPFPAPVLVAQGRADPLVRPEMQRAWVEGRCSAGIDIDYRTFPGLSHNTLVAADSPLTPQIVQWTLDRWDGKPATPNCDDLPASAPDAEKQPG